MMLLLLLALSWPTSSSYSSPSISGQGCPAACGDVVVPFPFGISPGCFLEGFDITCNTTFVPHKPFLAAGNLEVLSIGLDGHLQINNFIAHDCYDDHGRNYRQNSPTTDLKRRPYKFSNARNKFVAIGCDTQAYLVDADRKFSAGCSSLCDNMSYVINGTCSGIGCCETSVPKGLRAFEIWVQSFYNHTRSWNFSPCSYAFLADRSLQFNSSTFLSYEHVDLVPVTLEWAVGSETCEEASAGEGFACVDVKSVCYNSTNGQGYRCTCSQGYQGNAYLRGGCADINECETQDKNQCLYRCINDPGSYHCTCPGGTHGDGRKDQKGCRAKSPLLQTILGIGSCILFIVAGVSWLYWIIRKRRLIKLREKFFQQNGGLLLQQKISLGSGAASSLRIFTAEELEMAAENYDESQIIGKGGFGTVYRGVLLDQRVVAIKRSKISDKDQVEQFINEVVVLSNIIHRNVVKLLGCCLETQVPLLVYEFMSNGTLADHLHGDGDRSSLTLETRLRIAGEAAVALAYMHSSASTPIIHRDIKSSNILLDENFIAKVSDFGTSKLVPFDRSCLTSLVKGTFGYLDPEYFLTGQFTDKSDVYSFGVVLAELLTGEKAISRTRLPQGNGNLANYFLSFMSTENGLLKIVDRCFFLDEESKEKVMAVAELTERCLKIKRDERPAMREVAMVLESLRTEYKKHHSWTNKDKKKSQEDESLPLQPLQSQQKSNVASEEYAESDSSYNIPPLNILR